MVVPSFNNWIAKLRNAWWLLRSDSPELPLSNTQIHPFFIISSGRSGTTLLRKKLLSNPYIHIPPESDDFIPHNAIRFIQNNSEGWNKLTESILENFAQQPFFKFWAIDLSSLHEKLKKLPETEHSYAKLIDLLYLHACAADKPDLQIWGDKTPYLMYRLEWLRRIFPSARYIHLVRDGRAVVHSMVKKQSYSLEKAAVRWQDSIALFENHCRFVKRDAVMQIKYEDFVSNTSDTLRKTYEFIGVDFHTDYLKDHNFSLGDDVLPHHNDLHKPITSDAVDKWRREMPVNEIKWLNRKLKRELIKLDYAL